MPILENPRYEAFAQARAKGALLIDAYESAGFVRHKGHPSRLAWKAEVAERIAELRALQTDMEDVGPLGLLASLRRIIKAGESSDDWKLVNAARLAILDASRLKAELAQAQAADARQIDNDFNHFRTVDFKGEPPEGRPDRPYKAPQTAPKAAQPAPRAIPAAAPPTPRGLPETAPRPPGHLLASAARSPLVLHDLAAAASAASSAAAARPRRG